MPGTGDVTLADNVVAQPDNATPIIGCADRGTGRQLNQGLIRLSGNRIYQAPLKLDTACGGKAKLTAKLDVVVRTTRTASRASHPLLQPDRSPETGPP